MSRKKIYYIYTNPNVLGRHFLLVMFVSKIFLKFRSLNGLQLGHLNLYLHKMLFSFFSFLYVAFAKLYLEHYNYLSGFKSDSRYLPTLIAHNA